MNKDSLRWFIIIFITTFVLSITFSYISTNALNSLEVLPAIVILIAVILVGIVFDIIGVAITVANEHEFHAKATKKAKGSKASLFLIRNSAKVANICADVIGDICGVLSGAISAIVASKMASQYGISFSVYFKCYGSLTNGRWKSTWQKFCTKKLNTNCICCWKSYEFCNK